MLRWGSPIQFGKSMCTNLFVFEIHVLTRPSFIIQNVGLFWTKPIATRGDGGLAAYVVSTLVLMPFWPSIYLSPQELQRILSRGLDLLHTSTASATGLQSNFDYYLVTKTIEEQLTSWLQEWDTKLCSNSTYMPVLMLWLN